MLYTESQLEKDRMFRYVLARLSSLGPCKLSQTKEELKERTMKVCGLSLEEFEELFQDLRNQNDWDEISAFAYFKTVVMF